MKDAKHTTTEHNSSRRALLRGALALGGLALCGPTIAKPMQTGERRIKLHNLHTDERLNTIYWAKGGYIDEALEDINYLLRDFRQDEVVNMSTHLIDLLHSLQQGAGNGRTIEIISGYRSPKTNEMLRGNSHGVAKGSLHMQGLAVDIRIQGTELDHVHKKALSQRAGGVGYYPKSNFVHVDVGRVRNWRG